MKQGITIAAVALLLGLSVRTSHAQGAWRCAGADCPDGLVNEIEDRVMQEWTLYQFNMPAIPMSCVNRPDPCPHCVVADPSASTANAVAAPSAISQLTFPWTFILWRTGQSFLFGQYSASMSVFGLAEASGPSVAHASWTDTAINYSFAPPPPPGREVQIPGLGSSGVQDLDAVNFSIPSGSLWSGNLNVSVDMRDWAWCDLGYSGKAIHIDGAVTGRRVVDINYPIAWTAVIPMIADAIRTQFRVSVVAAVLD